jgi:hypothetical protein
MGLAASGLARRVPATRSSAVAKSARRCVSTLPTRASSRLPTSAKRSARACGLSH